MEYIDPYNFPELAIREYDALGGSVVPDLFHGTIFRVYPEQDFTMGCLRNQIDGAKFFIEVVNASDIDIYITWDSDYIGVNGGPLNNTLITSGRLAYFEVICRIGKMIVYDQEGAVSGTYLRNPADNAILLNPATGQPLLNPS